ncbi:hypothetical protein MASR2M50_30500 [Thauera sp.]
MLPQLVGVAGRGRRRDRELADAAILEAELEHRTAFGQREHGGEQASDRALAGRLGVRAGGVGAQAYGDDGDAGTFGKGLGHDVDCE